MKGVEALHSFWFGRFQVHHAPDGLLKFRDLLNPPARLVAANRFEKLNDRELKRAFFRYGFTPGAVGGPGAGVREAPADAHDRTFWQFPCRTEGAAWQAHAAVEPAERDGVIHVYLGLPWATWIDVERKKAWGPMGLASVEHQLSMICTRLAGLRGALSELGMELAVHTVCQHIYWRDMAATWQRLGVTDAWLSHCPAEGLDSRKLGFRAHPWALYAVNVRDPARRTGITENKDPAVKPVLASFMGAHAGHYLSDVRLKLRAFANEPRFVVKVTDKWHFEDVVYAHQVGNAPLASAQDHTDTVRSYNELLSDSVFSLCPAGAGPNTLRLWESLAVGAVPVLLGQVSAMPRGGSLPEIDWEKTVVRVSDDQLSHLPQLLRAIPLEQVREMQRLGMAAYAQVRDQRCFQ